MATTDQRVQEILGRLQSDYSLNNLRENDKMTLNEYARTIIEQEDVAYLIEELKADKDKWLDRLGAYKILLEQKAQLAESAIKQQQALGITQQQRAKDGNTSLKEYIRGIQELATEFIEKRFQNVYCPDCKVMTGRFIPVHAHTSYNVSFECSQCGKLARAKRGSKDIYDTIEDGDWRRNYPIEIKMPEDSGAVPDFVLEIEPDVVIGNEEEDAETKDPE